MTWLPRIVIGLLMLRALLSVAVLVGSFTLLKPAAPVRPVTACPTGRCSCNPGQCSCPCGCSYRQRCTCPNDGSCPCPCGCHR